KGDAKSRHSEILIIAAVAGLELKGLVDDRLSENWKSSDFKNILTLLGDEVKLVRVVFLAENEVPCEVSHQTNVAGNAKFQAGAELAERSGVMIVNRVIRCVFEFVQDEASRLSWDRTVDVLLIEVAVERRAAVNETDTSSNIGSKTAKRISRCQSGESASRKVRLCSKTKSLDAYAKVSAPEVLYIGTAAERIISCE